jgi:hypothetical protein
MTPVYIEFPDNTFTAWTGTAIDGVKYPPNIGALWSDEDLAALRLYRPEPPEAVPDSKEVASTSVRRIDGVVRYVHELADPPPPTLADYSAAVQALLDGAAQARDYAGIVSAVSYAGSSNAGWAAEGAAFAAWRDAVWLKVYAVLAEVQAGARQPPGIEGLLAELPALALPA